MKHGVSITSWNRTGAREGRCAQSGLSVRCFRRVRGAVFDLQRVRFDGRERRESGGWLGLSDLDLAAVECGLAGLAR